MLSPYGAASLMASQSKCRAPDSNPIGLGVFCKWRRIKSTVVLYNHLACIKQMDNRF